MQIKLDYYEILEALEAYPLDKHNIKCSLNDNPDYPYLDTTKVKYQTTKDPHTGNSTIDPNKTTYEQINVEINDNSDITIYI